MSVAAVCSSSARAEENSAGPGCFDALVSARIVRQTPTVIGECGDTCIIVEWPWIVDLDVRRVLEGNAPSGRITVLTIQHTYYRRGLAAGRWWLRRNSLGTFNVIRTEALRPRRCETGMAPAPAYYRPSDGQTLEDLRREGEARYGRQ
jgi:hypothetical protein